MADQITNYTYDIQKLYIEMFMSDADTFMRCANIFEPENFDRKLQESARFIKKYVDEYKVMPEPQIVNASCGTELNPASLPKENYEWLRSEERRVGKECRIGCRSRWSPYH